MVYFVRVLFLSQISAVRSKAQTAEALHLKVIFRLLLMLWKNLEFALTGQCETIHPNYRRKALISLFIRGNVWIVPQQTQWSRSSAPHWLLYKYNHWFCSHSAQFITALLLHLNTYRSLTSIALNLSPSSGVIILEMPIYSYIFKKKFMYT